MGCGIATRSVEVLLIPSNGHLAWGDGDRLCQAPALKVKHRSVVCKLFEDTNGHHRPEAWQSDMRGNPDGDGRDDA
jgi:hypothetical protein